MNHPKSKSYSARFPFDQCLQLEELRDKRECTISDVIRDLCRQSQDANKLKNNLNAMELRLRRTTFETICASIELSDEPHRDSSQLN